MKERKSSSEYVLTIGLSLWEGNAGHKNRHVDTTSINCVQTLSGKDVRVGQVGQLKHMLELDQ